MWISDYSAHVKSAPCEQLIEHGANVDALSNHGKICTITCSFGRRIDLDFVEFLLEAGADQKKKNAKAYSRIDTAGPCCRHMLLVRKFLLNCATDANITDQSGGPS
jgi:hypothetical protein